VSIGLGVRMTAANVSKIYALVRLTPFDRSTSDGRSNERHRRITLSTMAAIVGRVINAIVALVTVSVTLKYLGNERYGLWMTISSGIGMLSFADFGIGNGLLNAVTHAYAKLDHSEIARSISSSFFFLCAVAALLGVVFGLVFGHVDWSLMFNARSQLARMEAAPVVLAVVACFLGNIPLGIVARIQVGLQQAFLNDLWQTGGGLLSLIALLVGVRLRWGLPFLVLTACLIPLAATLANGLVLFRRGAPWLLPRLQFFHWRVARTMGHSGFMFFLVQLGYILSFSSDNLILARIQGPGAVAQYAVVQRVFLVAATINATWLTPLWPAYGEAIELGDSLWVRRTLKWSVIFATTITAVLSITLLIARGPLFHLWVGSGIQVPFSLAFGFAGWAVVQAAGNAVAMYLNGSNALEVQIILASVLFVVGTPLKFLLCTRFGGSGIVWGQVTAYLCLVAVPMAVAVPRLLKRHDNCLSSGHPSPHPYSV
jgi:O-antigen/teichoic acid export membrane protein